MAVCEFVSRVELLLEATGGTFSGKLLERTLGFADVPKVTEYLVLGRRFKVSWSRPDGERFINRLGYSKRELDQRLHELGFFTRRCRRRGFHYCPTIRTFGECHHCYNNMKNGGYHTLREGCSFDAGTEGW